MTPLEELRHSAAHVLAASVLRLFPETQLDIGPPTANGFYYDFDSEHRFSTEDFPAIEKEMQKIISEDQAFVRREVSREEATTLFQDLAQTFKISRLEDIPDDETISLYSNGDFTDLCAGTHLEKTSQISAFKLTSISGSYCLLYTSPSPRDRTRSRMPSSA